MWWVYTDHLQLLAHLLAKYRNSEMVCSFFYSTDTTILYYTPLESKDSHESVDAITTGGTIHANSRHSHMKPSNQRSQ